MDVLHFTTRVPESRQVTLTLPPDTPVGDAVLTVTVAPPSSVTYYRPADPAVAAEYDAFMRMLPDLRQTHGHQHVAVCGGRIVAAGTHLTEVHRIVRRAANGAAYYCGRVDPVGGYVFRSGQVVVPPAGGAS